jgi:hypothetical protein
MRTVLTLDGVCLNLLECGDHGLGIVPSEAQEDLAAALVGQRGGDDGVVEERGGLRLFGVCALGRSEVGCVFLQAWGRRTILPLLRVHIHIFSL